MFLAALKNIICAFAIICWLGCNQTKTKVSTDNQSNTTVDTITSIKKTDTVQYSTQPKKLNIDNWDLFWKSFTSATIIKDTATIIELTNFPFFQNSYPIYQDEFLRFGISQTFRLEKNDSTVLSDPIVLQMQKPDKEEIPIADSVRYTNKDGKDFYFAKVNGYCRLLVIITPG